MHRTPIVFVCAALVAACSSGGNGSSGDRDAGPIGGEDAGAGADSATPGTDGGIPPMPDRCGIVRVGGVPTCPGTLADQVFRHAVCSCGGGFLDVITDSYDSSLGMSGTPSGAPVGTQGDLVSFGGVGTPFEIGGSVEAHGELNSFDLVVHGDLWVGGRVLVWNDSTLHVLRDLHAAGPIEANDPGSSAVRGRVRVDRDLHQPAGLSNTADLTVGGAMIAETVLAPDGCPCADEKIIDVASIVTAAASMHDDATIALSPDSLAEVTTDTTIELGCGRYYFTGVRVASGATLTLRVTGHAALLVDGTFAAAPGGRIQADIDPEAELDLFVRGRFTERPAPGSDGADTIVLGSSSRAAAVRIYVADHPEDEPIFLPSSGYEFYGNLYAPRAHVAGGGSTVYGSIFAGGTNLNGVTVHYDRAVLGVVESCGDDPPAECDSCGDCPSASGCSGGLCGGCTTDADCCAPLVCYPGEGCGQLLI